MKFNKEHLLTALTHVNVGVAAKQIVSQADSYIFKEGSVYTFNDEIAVSHTIEHELTGAVHADTLYALLTKINDPIIDIEIVDDAMIIKSKKGKATLKSDEKQTLPLDTVGDAGDWYDLPDNFNHLMSFVLMSVSKDLATPILTCVHWTSEYVESCDNFRLTRTLIDTPDLDSSILIPGNTLTQMIFYEPTQYSIANDWAHFKTADGSTFACRVFEGDYVDLDDVYELPGTDTILFTNAMQDLLERVSVLADTDVSNNTKAVVDVKDSMATVTASNTYGEMVERTRVKCKVDLSFDLRIETLQHIMKYYKKAVIADDRSSLKFSDDTIIHIISLI